MEQSILKSTKKVLGLSEDYTVFDLDVLTHVNGVFTTLHQLGVGPGTGFMIEDDTALWTDFLVPTPDLNAVKSYVFLRVRLLFDPPSTSFHLEAMNNQIKELEWRLNVSREYSIDPDAPPVDETTDLILDGGASEGWG